MTIKVGDKVPSVKIKHMTKDGVKDITTDEIFGGKKVALAQSGAIVLYCAEKSGKLLPKDPAKRAEAYQWFMQATTDIAPTSSSIFYEIGRAHV